VRGIAADLAHALREIVAPRLGAEDGRAHARESIGGDVTFAIDAEAEAFLEGWVAANAPGVAFYSEDRGMVESGPHPPSWVLVVDPIDGTRPALAGLEAACTSVALAPLGEGCRASGPIAPSVNTDIERLFWVYGFTRRPARAVVEVIGELIDRSSLGGGVFDLGSATFDLTRILTGQLDAYVEPGPRMIDDVPEVRAEFERVGDGAVLNNSPYDLAAATICLKECGAVVTDAYGEPLDSRPLLGSDHEFQMSCVAAANPELHSAICAEIDTGIERLRRSVTP
jgi:myo-inositol-1(or 4)-monophosphatase